jgi:hypothetical protein
MSTSILYGISALGPRHRAGLAIAFAIGSASSKIATAIVVDIVNLLVGLAQLLQMFEGTAQIPE